MGLKRKTSATYLQVVNGFIAQRVKIKTPTSTTRVTTEGATVEEEVYESIEGTIVGLDTKVHDQYGETLMVWLQSDDQMYCLQMGLNSRYGANFLKTLPNVDLNLPVEISPSEKTVDNKKDITIFLKQNNTPLKRFYTKDHGDCPEPILKKGKRGKKDEWDFSGVTEFLYETVLLPIKEGLKEKAKQTGFVAPQSNKATGKPTGEPIPEDDTQADAIPGDDLPF